MVNILIDRELCLDCGFCVDLCDAEVLDLENDFYLNVVNLDNCTECKSCEDMCTENAIKVWRT